MEEKEEEFRGFNDDIDLDPEDFEEDDDEPKADDDKKVEDKPKSDEKDSTSDEKAKETDDVKDGEDGKDPEDDEGDDKAVKKAKEAEKNHYFAEKRKAKEEAERKAKEDEIKRTAKLEAELGIVTKNPYTETPVTNEAELEAYKIMKEIDEAGGDPIADFYKEYAKRKTDEIKKAEADKKAKDESSKKINSEVAELAKAYPKIDFKELAEDKEYTELCEAKGGRWTMLECYEYLMSKRTAKKNVEESKKDDKVAEEAAKKMSKVPGSQSSGGKSSQSYLEMSDEDYLKLQKEKSQDFFS